MDNVIFKDRQAEYLNRVRLTSVEGSADEYDVTPVWGTVTEKGTPLNAQTFNEMQELMKENFIKTVYPVGSIYMSVDSTSPAEMFGGIWERIQGRFLLGAGIYGVDHNNDSANYPAGMTGGEMRHTLSEAEMPSHTHWLKRDTSGVGGGNGNYLPYSEGVGDKYENEGPVLPTGGNQPHNNMPPYLAVYMWKRVG